MLIYLPERKPFNTRKEAKDYLGGTNKYNKAFKNGDLFFMNDLNIANNDTLYCHNKGHNYNYRK